MNEAESSRVRIEKKGFEKGENRSRRRFSLDTLPFARSYQQTEGTIAIGFVRFIIEAKHARVSADVAIIVAVRSNGLIG